MEDRFEADQVSRNVRGQIQVVKHTLEAPEAAVRDMRSEIPIGVSGQPIERVPVTEQSEMLVKMGTFVKLMGGRQICLRVVEIPLQGGKAGRFHCSRLCMSVGTNSGYFCPEHDRHVFSQGNVPSGKVINSASIPLTSGESMVQGTDKDGKKVNYPLLPGRDHALSQPALPLVKSSVAPKTRKPRSDSGIPRLNKPKHAGRIQIELTLEQLEAPTWDVFVVDAISAALDNLPATSIAEMKRVVKIQEKLEEEGQCQPH